MNIFDVAVLGGGPGGYEAAIRCARYGLRTVLIEARELGGTCLNRGCIPTKALLHGANVYETVKNAAVLGISTGEAVLDYTLLAAYKDDIIGKLRKGIEASEKANGVTMLKGFGTFKDSHTIDVDGIPIKANNIILATGSAPACPPIPGINGENIMTSDRVLAMTSCPESFIIIGGGVIGLEFATLFSTLGKKVTILEMMSSILPGMDADIIKLISRILRKKGIEIYTDANIVSIAGGPTVRINYEHNGEAKSCTGACCIVSTGRDAQTKSIGLENLGIRMNRAFVEVDHYMRTNIPNIYAIGDITGKMQLAHVATAQGLVAAANCAGKNKSMRYDIIPSCIYTSPEIAFVGITAQKAKKAGRLVNIGTFDVAYNGKVTLMGAQPGIVKIVSDACTGEILGAQIMAPSATDMIAEICAVMKSEGTIEELATTIHPHPTVSEIIMEAAKDAAGLR